MTDLESKLNNLKLEVVKLKKMSMSEEGDASGWQDILTELGDRRKTNKLLKEKKEEELSTYRKGKAVRVDEKEGRSDGSHGSRKEGRRK